MPHLNELHAKFEGRGLSIVGVTGEGQKDTEPWIEKHGVKYAYAYDQGRLFAKLGLDGYPSAVLVDAKGTVVWIGHPGQIEDELIEKHLAGASTMPAEVAALCKSWPDSARAAKDALKKGQLGKAIAAAKSAAADPQGQQIVHDLEVLVQRRLEAVDARRAEGDVLGAIESAKQLEKSLTGSPLAQEASNKAKAIADDKAAAAIVRDQKQLAALDERIAKARTAKALQALVSNVEQIRRKDPESFVGRSAKELLGRIEDRLAALR